MNESSVADVCMKLEKMFELEGQHIVVQKKFKVLGVVNMCPKAINRWSGISLEPKRMSGRDGTVYLNDSSLVLRAGSNKL